MVNRKFEQLLAFHCAPTLVGAKSASLISLQKSKFRDFTAILQAYQPCLTCKGISTVVLAESDHYTLMLVYRKMQLEHVLKEKRNMEILTKFGYRETDSVEDHLAYLKTRMKLKKAFPHEIGLFLGYPYEDVVGFIENGGQKFALSGYWKVYANIQETKKLFDFYTECTHDFCKNLNKGISMEKLLEAV